MAHCRQASRVAVAVVCLGAAVSPAAAQDLDPKAYSASPVGVTFVVASVLRSTGTVLTDPTLPVTDIKAKIVMPLVAWGHAFGLAGKLALISAAVPYAWGDVSGNVAEEARSVSRTGLADARIRLSVNLLGNPSMRPLEFAAAPRRTIVGVSLTAIAPTGQYDGTKLINLGTNRWAFRPEVGVSVPRGRWDLDAYLGVWLFLHNDDFYPGNSSRAQDAMVAFQAHWSYTFRPRLWLAADGTWYAGGDARVNGGEPAGGVNNSRLGLTLSLPAGRQQSFKIAYSAGAIVRSGSNFKTVSVGWQWVWLAKP
jgi:hypothetical protein